MNAPVSLVDEAARRMWLTMQVGDFETTGRLAKQVLNTNSRHARAKCCQAILAWRGGNRPLAQELAARACSFDPTDAAIFTSAGRIELYCGNFEEGIRYYDAALTLSGGLDRARLDRAYALLYAGRWEEGWTEHEARLGKTLHYSLVAQRLLRKPKWKGDKIDGILLVMHEGGYGDCIMFARYLRSCIPLARKVVFKVSKRLGDLLRTLDPLIEIDDGPLTDLPPFDQFCFAMSLPHLLKQPLPIGKPYLGLVRREPYSIDGKPNIALAWGGNPLHARDKQRSLDAEALQYLIDLDGVVFHSVQVGPHANTLTKVAGRENVIVHEPKDFAETASLLSRMDLTVTVDTSIAHLGGACGLPVWVALYSSPEFRWGYKLPTTPWYDTARLFRQHKPGDWFGSLGDIKAAIRKEFDL